MGAVISSSEEEQEEEYSEDEEAEWEDEKSTDLVPDETLHEPDSDSDSTYSESSSTSSSDDDSASFFGDSTTSDESSDLETESDFDDVVEGTLFGMGNPLLDLSANVAEGYLKKYGLKEDDAILAEEKHKPMYDELVELFPVEYIAGGATQNAIKVAQWMLGVPRVTTFVGCIGRDKFGEILKQKAEEIGVQTAYYIQDKEPTGTCAALLCNYSRSLCANLAAANLYDKDHLDQPETWSLVEKANYYYIAGFFLTVSQDSIIEIGKHAAENGKTFMMNLSAPFLCQFFKDNQVAALPYVDIMFGNETEAETFAKVHNFGTEDVGEIAAKIAGWNKINSTRPRIVVITQGHEQTVVANGPHDVKKFPILPIKKEQIIDTNGAGDAFVGGYLAQLVRGKSIEDCIHGAHFAGNMVIQQHGCTFPEKCTFQG